MWLFLRLYALFAVVHEVVDSGHSLRNGVSGAGLSLASIVLSTLAFAFPRQIGLVTVWLTVWTAHKINAMPFTPNHVLLTTVLNLVLLTVIGVQTLTRGKASVLDALAEYAAPVIRAAVIVIYGFAVLHKLNHDYINPDVSCGTVLYAELKERLPILPVAEWTRWPTVIGSLITEGVIGALLVFRRTRILGLAVGVAFHTLLVFHINKYVASFSTLVTALYTPFIPLKMLDDAAALWGRLALPGALKRRVGLLRWLPLALLAGTAAVAGAYLVSKGAYSPDAIRRHLDPGKVPETLATIVACGYAALFFTVLALGRTFTGEPGQFRLRPTPALLALPLLLLNGLAPYLGIKTQTSFSMFSNLRTEMNSTNHLFMPVLARLNPYQEQMVVLEATSSSFSRMEGYVQSGEMVPLFELRRAAANDPSPDFFVTYVDMQTGVRHEASRASGVADPALEPAPWLARKLLPFRSVPLPDEPCTCDH
jgi:hypothetical protein